MTLQALKSRMCGLEAPNSELILKKRGYGGGTNIY